MYTLGNVHKVMTFNWTILKYILGNSLISVIKFLVELFCIGYCYLLYILDSEWVEECFYYITVCVFFKFFLCLYT